MEAIMFDAVPDIKKRDESELWKDTWISAL